jgi:hypothetical protein
MDRRETRFPLQFPPSDNSAGAIAIAIAMIRTIRADLFPMEGLVLIAEILGFIRCPFAHGERPPLQN